MNERPIEVSRSKTAEKVKLTIASLLACVLLTILFWPTAEPPDEKSQAELSPAVTPSLSGKSFPQVRTPVENALSGERIPDESPSPLTRKTDIDLQRLLAHNPFFDSSRASQSQVEPSYTVAADVHASKEEARGTLPAFPIRAIITGGNEPTAWIGTRVYRVNDWLDGGWQITAITRDGIRVQRGTEDSPMQSSPGRFD